MDIEIALFDGFDELDGLAPYEVISTGRLEGADLSVSYRTLSGTGTVNAAHGTRIESDGELGDTDPAVVIVPGGGWTDRADAGAWAEAERGALPDRLEALAADGATMASVCTGALLLARAGLLADRPATTHHAAIEDLREAGATVVEERVVDAGDVVTAGGVTSGLDLALYLVARECDPEIAARVERRLEYERRGRVHRAV